MVKKFDIRDVPTDPRDGLPGLSVETAAHVILRDKIKRHLTEYSDAIMRDRKTGANAVAAFVDGLAGTMAMCVISGQVSRDDCLAATVHALRKALDRDLLQLATRPVHTP